MMPQSPDFQEFLNHLTNNALSSLKHADSIARSLGSAYIGTEHLLLGVLAQQNLKVLVVSRRFIFVIDLDTSVAMRQLIVQIAYPNSEPNILSN